MSNEAKELIIGDRTGFIVKQIRLQLNCTQKELGKKIGIDQSTLCQIERRHILPKESTLQKLAHIAGVSVYQLTGQEPINYRFVS